MILRSAVQAGALLLKEIQHHWTAMIGVAILYLAMAIVVLAAVLNQQAGSVIETAANLGWFAAPMVSAFLVRRLVVLEYKQGTYEFLTGLPSSALGRAAVKGAFGLVLVQGVAALTTLLIALLASGQEITPIAFVAQAVVQIAVYVWAWYAIIFMAAHFGRFRAVFWLLFFPALLTVYTIDERLLEAFLWTASLANPLDQARVFVPWEGIAITSVWALGFSILGLAIAGVRGGALVSGWFRPAHTRERAVMAVVVILGLFAISYAEEIPWLGGPVYGSVPPVREGAAVRVVGSPEGSLSAHGERIQRTLDRMEPHLSGELPDLILLPAHGEPEEVVELRSSQFRELVMVVDVDRSEARVEEEALALLLDWWNGTQLRRRGGLAWVALGAGRWWSSSDDLSDAYRLRAAFAASRLQGPESLADLRRVEAELGTDVARAVSWVGLYVLAQEAGEQVADDWVESWLRHEASDDLTHTVRMDALSPDGWFAWQTGADPDAHRKLWFEELQRLAAVHADAIAPWRPLDGELRASSGEEAEVVIESRLFTPVPADLYVRWAVLPELHDRPLPGTPWESERVEDPVERLPTSAPGHRALAIRYDLYVPDFEGHIFFGRVKP